MKKSDAFRPHGPKPLQRKPAGRLSLVSCALFRALGLSIDRCRAPGKRLAPCSPLQQNASDGLYFQSVTHIFSVTTVTQGKSCGVRRVGAV